jgi:hypothetical protein
VEGCSSEENWLCLSCGGSRCSRYANSHNLSHWRQSGHNIALSLRDLSIWCYSCEKYVKSALLDDVLAIAEYCRSHSDPNSLTNLPSLVLSIQSCCLSYDPFTEKHSPDLSAPAICQLENPKRTKSIIQFLTDQNLLFRFPLFQYPTTLNRIELSLFQVFR